MDPSPTQRKSRLVELFGDLLQTLAERFTVLGILVERVPDDEDDPQGMKPERTQ